MSFLHQILSINKESMTGIALMRFYDYFKFDTFFLTHTLPRQRNRNKEQGRILDASNSIFPFENSWSSKIGNI